MGSRTSHNFALDTQLLLAVCLSEIVHLEKKIIKAELARLSRGSYTEACQERGPEQSDCSAVNQLFTVLVISTFLPEFTPSSLHSTQCHPLPGWDPGLGGREPLSPELVVHSSLEIQTARSPGPAANRQGGKGSLGNTVFFTPPVMEHLIEAMSLAAIRKEGFHSSPYV